jgi:serine/threonine-protein kinase
MAEVYRASESGFDGFERPVAIKRILPHIAADPEFIAMFHDEAKLVVQLMHKNIAQVYKLGEQDGSFYIALEFIEGCDLRQIQEYCMRREEPMPLAHACWIVACICDGLDYAHTKRAPDGRNLGLIHRDVSPPNIMVGFEGEVKLIDFGLAKASTATTETGRGILKGKLAYLSPEQARGETIDHRSDIFSAGIVLFEALTATRLFLGEDDLDTIERVRACKFMRPSEINRRVPWRLENICRLALERDRDQRYQSAEEMSRALKHFLRTAGLPLRGEQLAEWLVEHFGGG